MSAKHRHGPDPQLVCREIVELATEYLEGALSAGERRRFEAHLGECPYCVEYVEQIGTVSGSLGDLSGESLSDERREALLKVFRDRL